MLQKKILAYNHNDNYYRLYQDDTIEPFFGSVVDVVNKGIDVIDDGVNVVKKEMEKATKLIEKIKDFINNEIKKLKNMFGSNFINKIINRFKKKIKDYLIKPITKISK